MSEQPAIMFVFAGNNGSGKSTIRNLIVDRLGIGVNIDPDALARRIDSINPERRKVSAGKEAIKLARDCILNKRDFSVETTLAGGNAIRHMQEAKANGFELAHLDLIDHLIVIDNSDSDGEIVLEADCKTINYRAETIPKWVEVIEKYLHSEKKSILL